MSNPFHFFDTDQTAIRGEAEAAIQAILAVHNLPDLPQIDVIFTASARYGGYTPATAERSRVLELSVASLTPRLTTVHEVGHFIDDALGGFEVYSSQEPVSPLSDVIEQAQQTEAIRVLRDYVQQTQSLFSPERLQALNRLEPIEIWARAYSQYIALRSRDAVLLADIQKRRDSETGVLTNEQWEWHDFAPIAQEIAALFLRLRWQK